MSNSVVKVTESTSENDSDTLFLLINEDGTVTPNKDVVDKYLGSKTTATNLQVMHISKSDDKGLEVDVNSMLYLPLMENEGEYSQKRPFDEIAFNLHNIKLDHDYTNNSQSLEDVDELAKTLSILDGSEETPIIELSQNRTVDESTWENFTAQISSATQKEKPSIADVKSSSKRHAKRKKSKSVSEKEDVQGKAKEHSEETSPETVESPKKTNKHTAKESSEKLTKQTSEEKSPAPAPQTDPKTIDKKGVKKEKKIVKPAPDDFALFSTPDIIKRVGGKEGNAEKLENTTPDKPAKIDSRSKSFTEVDSVKKQSRFSFDGKINDKQFFKEDKKIPSSGELLVESIAKKKIENKNVDSITDGDNVMPVINENRSFANNLSDIGTPEALDGSGLDLDPTLLDNINNDLISEEILYQVAQSLVSNTELQNAIDKSLNEDSSVLEAVENMPSSHDLSQETFTMSRKGTQVVRSDGRVVLIPPIERPATRSRNKRKAPDSSFLNRKPLDDEHVSGNELDSSSEEEESEDDPNKLWCICNQPHNNRFMICCDTCEEWYHGKCVNITKAMGQQMESEGREWICLFCKDPLLRRPHSAAKRIRRASRNSRQSSDSNSSTKVVEVKSSTVPCVVCRKPSRSNSIFCSEACILTHAQGVERVVVFDRATGNMLTGNKAPSASNLEQWLKEHPGYEVVRSAGKIVTTKIKNHQTQAPSNVSTPKLKILSNFRVDKHSTIIQAKKIGNELIKKPIKLKHLQIVNASPKGTKLISPEPLKQISPLQQKEKLNSTPRKSTTATPPSKVKSAQTNIKASIVSKEKLSPKTPKTPAEPPRPKQENIRDNVQKTIFEQLTNRMKLVDDLKLTETELKSISTEIESQLFRCFGDTGQKYRNKYRSLIFNIKDIKNQTLWRRICEKSINPYQLVRLSPDDLASQELALWREREAKHQLDMIKKSELELLKCNRQYVLKTHKGEQILEDNRPTDNLDNSEVITSLTDAPSSERTDRKKSHSKEGDKKKYKHSSRSKDRGSKERSDSRGHHKHSKDRDRKRSRSRDVRHGDSRRMKSEEREKHKRSHKSSRHKKDASTTDKLDKKSKEILEQLVDNKIVPPLEDRLWKHVPQQDVLPAATAESDSDHEPTSTVTIPTPPRNVDSDDLSTSQDIEDKNVKLVRKDSTEGSSDSPSPLLPTAAEEIWRGVINMIDVAQISITAHEVSGECSGLGAELPSNLDIVGRISPDTVWDYIGKMKCSNSKIISVVRLNATNVEEKMPYIALYSYLSSRNRLGVVKSTNKAVKDFYILPLASQKPIPQALLPLNGPGFEESRPALLLGIIVRDKRKRPYLDTLTSSVSAKKSKFEYTAAQPTLPARSYTPPPVADSKQPASQQAERDNDEPYSPEDSDPDNAVPSTSKDSASFIKSDANTSQTFEPFANKFEDIPGLDNAPLPSSTQEIQRQMEKLNKEIEMQKSEINSISQNIATASTEIGTTALANIALPSNLQQILDSIKTIGTTPGAEVPTAKQLQASAPMQGNADFTIPLILPTTFSRNSAAENTIPLNLPGKKKTSAEAEKSSVLSSLSEEDLIRKAEEMLEEEAQESLGDDVIFVSESKNQKKNFLPSQPTNKVEISQPPIPGLEDTF